MHLGTKIRYMLAERDITQDYFSHVTGINRTTLLPKAHRRNQWRKTTVYAAACFFGMSVEELVADTDAETYIF